MTVSTLADEIMDEVGEDKSDSVLKGQFEKWLEQGVDRIITDTGWDWLNAQEDIATVASTEFYNASVTAESLRYARITAEDEALEIVTRSQLVDLGHDLEEEGRPRYVYLYDLVDESGDQVRRIGFHPIPNAIYTIEVGYKIGSARLSTGTQIPLPNGMLFVLRDWIRCRYYISEQNLQQAEYHRQLFLASLENFKAKHRLSGEYHRLRAHTGGSDWFEPVRLPPNKFRNYF